MSQVHVHHWLWQNDAWLLNLTCSSRLLTPKAQVCHRRLYRAVAGLGPPLVSGPGRNRNATRSRDKDPGGVAQSTWELSGGWHISAVPVEPPEGI